MKYHNESEQEYLRSMTFIYARLLRRVYNYFGINKSDTDIWRIAEKEVIERYKRKMLE